VVVAFSVLSGGFLYFTGEVVPPGYIGVRQTYFGPWEGYSDRGLFPGLHWTFPFYSEIHLIPSTVRLVSFTRESETQAARTVAPPLDVKTADGSVVDVDVSVLVSPFDSSGNIEKQQHGGPAELIKRLSLDPGKWDQQVLNVASAELKRALSNLGANAFYLPDQRELYTNSARLAISSTLAPFGLRVEEVLLRRYTYRDTRIDEAIFRKNLQDQEERYNQAESARAAVRAESEKEASNWDAQIETLRIEGESQAAVLRSEASAYERQRFSEGDLAVARAQAEVDRLKAGALAGSGGASIYVARQMVPYLDSLRGGVVASIDPYDVEGWVKRLGVEETR
jgi:regulator of protease activity HflC (stomatin/prohibitin superfamily)